MAAGIGPTFRCKSEIRAQLAVPAAEREATRNTQNAVIPRCAIQQRAPSRAELAERVLRGVNMTAAEAK